MSMPIRVFNSYLIATDVFRAQEKLEMAESMSFPNLKRSAQNKWWRKLSREIKSRVGKDGDRLPSYKEVVEKMARMMGNG